MLHGYTACPSQFDALAKIFYDRGYNVYIPREPHHGIVGDSRQYSPMDAADMVQYASTSVTRGSGLGKHVGVIGLSGGGVLATWAAQYRDDVVQRALVLSPFYRPAASQVPAWQIRPLAMLYGNKILPDNFSEQPHKGFSFYGLGQYLKIVENYDTNKNLPNLQRLALVYSEGDTAIDHNLAQKIPSQLAAANPQTSYEQYAIPKTWGVGHDIVMANQPDINHHEAELFARYVELYEKSATVK
jgi:carboxylesterase